MKLSKVSWIFLIVGIIVIGAASMGMTRSTQTEQQSQLEVRLRTAKQKLALIKNDILNNQKEQLLKQIETYNSQITTTRGKLSFTDDDIAVTGRLLEAAKVKNISIVTISSSGKAIEKLSGTTCTIIPLNLRVEGNVLDIRDFVMSLSSEFPTGIVSILQINRAAPSPTPSPIPDTSPTPTPVVTVPLFIPVPEGFSPIVLPEVNGNADITLVLYNYKGE